MPNKLQYKNFITEDLEKEIMESISNIFDCTVSVANNSELKISKKIFHSHLCEYIENDKKCNEVCKATTEKLAKKVLETGEVVTGYCPFGFIKTVVPIKILDEIVGAIYCCGQFYEKKPSEKQIKTLIKKYDLDEKKYQKYIDEIKILDEKKLTIARNEISKNIKAFTKVLYNNYILKELAKREMFLKEITRVILNTSDKDEVISEVVERLAREFDIQRVAIIEMTEDRSYVKDDYINGRNIRLENLTKQEYAFLFKRLKIRAEENGGIFVLNKKIVEASVDTPEALKRYWKITSLKTLTTFLVKTEDIKRMIIFCSYGQEKDWSIDELAFLSAVSEQIAMALRLSDLYEASVKTVKTE